MTVSIGIDLGTTYSVMAYLKEGVPTIIPNAEGNRLTPSVVSVDPELRVFVGDMAKARAVLDPLGTVSSIKRKMGTKYSCKLHGGTYTPVMLSSFILKKLKKDAEEFFDYPVQEAVITVPAYFNDLARQATKNAAEIAGWRVLRIINEPTAATLAYGLGQKGAELVMVCDLGGGTFDVSILEFSRGMYEVRSTSGNTELGGDDWTAALTHYLRNTYCMETQKSQLDPQTHHRISIAAEEAKLRLSNEGAAEVRLPSIKTSDGHRKNVEVTIHRSRFEQLTDHLCEKLIPHIEQAIFDAKIKTEELDKIILVGGATRMPMVRQLIAKFSGRPPFIDLNPDEVVALGAAVQAGVISGALKDVILVDVIPLSLGIETLGGIFAKIIDRNSKVPISKDRLFTTAVDNQPEVVVHVLQGERELAKHNVSLGEFTLKGIPEAPRGAIKVEVTFSVDVNGILTIRAKDVHTENEVGITIQQDSVRGSDIKQLLREAREHQEGDRVEKEKVMNRIELDGMVQAAKQLLGEIGPGRENTESIELKRLVELGERKIQEKSEEAIKAISSQIREVLHVLHQEYKKSPQTKITA